MEYRWKLSVFTKWDDVDDPVFFENWKKWYESVPLNQVFSHPVLIKTWTDCYRKFQNLEPLYCVAQTGDTVFFLPLICWYRNWKNAFLKIVVPAGFSDYDYHDPLVTAAPSPELLRSFWSLIQQKVLASSQTEYDMVDMDGMHFPGMHMRWEKDEACPFINLKKYGDFSEYFSRLGKSLRKDITRRRRMLDGLGKLSYHVYGRDELEKALQVLPQFLDAHEKKWPNSFKMPGFHEALLTNGLPVGLVHFSEIRIDGNPVSWELGFRDSSKAYSYMPAYRNEYSSYSIGKVHLAWLIEECFQNGLSTFDFMRGAEEYKNDWTDLQADTHRYREFAGGFQSRIKLFADGAIKQVKHLVRLSPIYVFFAEFFRNLSSFLKHEFCSSPELYDVFVEFLAYSVLA